MMYIPLTDKKTETRKLLEEEGIEFEETVSFGGRTYDVFLPANKTSGIWGLLGKKVPIKTLDDIIPKICGKGLAIRFKYDNGVLFERRDREFGFYTEIKVKGYKYINT